MARRKKRIPTPPYRSCYEEDQAANLKKRKVAFDYELKQYTFHMPSTKRGLICDSCGSTKMKQQAKYTPDFTLYYKGSRKKRFIIVETKGKMLAPVRNKDAAFVEEYPDIDYRLVFMANNKLSRTSKTRYSDWATKVGIKYAVGDIPDAWLKELGYKVPKNYDTEIRKYYGI